MKEASDFENQIWGGECVQKMLLHAEAGQNISLCKGIGQGLGWWGCYADSFDDKKN